MTIPIVMERGYMGLMDLLFRRWPQPAPPPERAARCKLVSHRGEHDNRVVLENTLRAFDRAVAAGVWGIEMDVRWTRDAVPVVVHDADLRRLHGVFERVDHLTWRVLRRYAPSIPALSQVVDRFGGRVHLMIEVKAALHPDAEIQNHTLQKALAPLVPAAAFHIMALTPQTLFALCGFPPQSRIAIAHHRPDRLSRLVAQNRWGGICAHYTMMRRSIIKRHRACGQCIGTGFAASRNCLHRELNRGVDWIFSNNAVQLQGLLR